MKDGSFVDFLWVGLAFFDLESEKSSFLIFLMLPLGLNPVFKDVDGIDDT
jgi:hypothetical protein